MSLIIVYVPEPIIRSSARRKGRWPRRKPSKVEEISSKKIKLDLVSVQPNMSSTEVSSPLPLANKYGVLKVYETPSTSMEVENPSTSSPSTSSTSAPAPVKVYKPQPIIITSKIDGLENFHQKIKKLCKSKFVAQYNRDTIKLNFETDLDYKTVCDDLTLYEVEYYTYTAQGDRLKKIVMKAAPYLTEDNIKNELKANNLNVESVKKLSSKSSNQSKSFLIAIKNSENVAVSDLTAVKTVDSVRVQWQTFNRRDTISQCHRCQGFGHGSSNCQRLARCVKCAGQHLSSACPLGKRTETPRCINCQGPHPANYRFCPKYAAYQAYVESKRPKQASPHSNVPQPSAPQPPQLNNIKAFPTITPGIKYSSILTNEQPAIQLSQPTIPSTSNESDDLNTLMREIKELNDLFNISSLIQMVREMKTGLTQCKDPLSRLQFLNQFALKWP